MKKIINIIIVVVGIILPAFDLFGIEKSNQKDSKFGKAEIIAINDIRKIDVNRISALYQNNGEFYSDYRITSAGFEWPKGTRNYAIFSAGLWIGAKVNTDSGVEIRVATCGHFGSEYRPGRILSDGTPEDFTLPHLKIYQVKPLIDLPTTNPDYMQWPIDQGAPWIDIDKNNQWDPYIDKIGIIVRNDTIYPDVVQFCVFNDADINYHNWIYGRSKPLGVEVRQTVWAFKNIFPDVQFIRFQIYNKSNRVLDSTFFTLWSDPDLGFAFDDNVGCDTTFGVFNKRHNLGYCYNADNYDEDYGYGFNPPAVGFKLLTGPVVPSENDSAYSFGKILYGYRNLDLHSFITFCNLGRGGCINPDWYDPFMFEQSYNIMKGLTRTGKPWVDPFTNDTIKFVFAGDPVSGQGFIQNNLFAPGDMRMCMSTGPITMAPLDSQEITFVALIGRGIDNVNSIIKIRHLSNSLNYLIYEYKKIPNASVSILNQDPYLTQFLLRVKVNNAVNITALIYNERGEILSHDELYDDGLHEDSLNNDDIWANWFHTVGDSMAMNVSLMITYNDGRQQIWDNVVTNINAFGRVTVDSFIVLSDNINKDFLPNPGENIRFKVLVKNRTNYTIRKLITSISESLDSSIMILTQDAFKEDLISPGVSRLIPDTGYISINILSNAIPGHEVRVVFTFSDDNGNLWYDTLKMLISPFTYPPIDTTVNHISGESEGKFKILLLDHSQLKNNEYEISVKKVPEIRFNLVNITAGDTLLKLYELPDVEGHNIPVIDGFRISRGTVDTKSGIKNVSYMPIGNKWFTKSDAYKVDISNYGVSYPHANNFIGRNSKVPIDELKVVEIRFSNFNTQKAYRYLSGFAPFPPFLRTIRHPEFRPFVIDSVGGGFIYQDYELYPLGNSVYGRTVPFTVWEIDLKSGFERQLNIAIIESNDSLYRIVNGQYQYIGRGNIDGKWWPTHASNGGGEILVIFASTYSEQADTFYTRRNLQTNFSEFDVYYVFTPKILDSISKFFEGDIMRIIPYFPITERDKFVFNPLKLLNVEKAGLTTAEYILYNCYPNPFNFHTNIRFQIPEKGKLTMDIFNILGQKVRTLFDDQVEPGTYSVLWDGKDNAEMVLPSGVYFIRMKVNHYIDVKKAILLK